MARPEKTGDEGILAALANRPEATAAEVAERLAIGKSTAAKRLAALEEQGAVLRVPGGRADGVRAPDRFRLPATAAEDAGSAAGRGNAAGADSNAARLGRGALGALVREFLAARPAEAFGPAAVGKALGRSQGAVSNALAAMAERGEVALVGDKPRRYRIAGRR